MKRLLLALGFLLLANAGALAQSCPTFTQGKVLTAGQWQACFDSKQAALGYTPVNRAGDTMQGKLLMAASSTSAASTTLLPGVAPTSPVDGDMWTTTGGLFVRINGATVGPLTGGGSASFAGTSPIGVTFPAGVVTYAFDFTVANSFLATQTFRTVLAGTTNTYDVGTNASTAAFRTIYAGTSFVGPAGVFTTSATIGAGSAITSSGPGGALASGAFAAAGITALTGDVTATGPGSVAATIAANVVTYAKFQQVAASSLVGNATGSLANATGITLGATLAFSGSALQTAAHTGDVTTSANSFVTTLATAQPAVHTWALAQTFTVAPVFTDASGSRTALGLGTIATQAASSVAITGGTIAGLTGLAIRDTSAAFDVTIAATSSAALSAGRTLTLNMGNVAHTLAFGTTANTITFPNLASYTVITNGDTGSVTNAMLANASTTVNSQTCTLGASCTVTATATSITIGTTTVASGATLGILYQNGASPTGTIGQYTLTGSGTVAVMQTSPSLITPALGVASGSSLALAGCTIGGNTLCVTGATALAATTLSSTLTYGGVTLSASVSGTGSMVLTASPTFTGTVNAAALTTSGVTTINGTGGLKLASLNNGQGIGYLCWNNPEVTFGGATCSSSDERIKNFSGDLSPEKALAGILTLRPRYYRLKDAASDKRIGPQLGLGAQNVRTVFPEVTTVGGDSTITSADGKIETIKNTMGLAYDHLAVPLIGAIQAHEARIKALEGKAK